MVLGDKFAKLCQIKKVKEKESNYFSLKCTVKEVNVFIFTFFLLYQVTLIRKNRYSERNLYKSDPTVYPLFLLQVHIKWKF